MEQKTIKPNKKGRGEAKKRETKEQDRNLHVLGIITNVNGIKLPIKGRDYQI